MPCFQPSEEKDPTEDFITSKLKTQWCPLGGAHDWDSCVYAHTYRDWRRTPLLGYSSRPCPHWSKSMKTCPGELPYAKRCPNGMACPLAHGAKEQLYHPRFYKTSPCSEASCTRGTLCAFMHGPHDARQLLPDKRSYSHPIPGAAMLLEMHQPGHLNPVKYLGFEEPLRGVRSSTGETTTNSRPPQLRRRQRRGAGSQRAAQAALAESPDIVLESAATEILSVPSDAHLKSIPEGTVIGRSIKQAGSMWADGAAEREWNDVGCRLGRLFLLPDDCD